MYEIQFSVKHDRVLCHQVVPVLTQRYISSDFWETITAVHHKNDNAIWVRELVVYRFWEWGFLFPSPFCHQENIKWCGKQCPEKKHRSLKFLLQQLIHL